MKAPRLKTGQAARATALLLIGAGLFLVPKTASALDIRTRARALKPGEVVELTVTDTHPIRGVEARAFDRIFPVYPTGSGRTWRGLIGIDLELRPGSYTVSVTAERVDGSKTDGSSVLVVLPRSFPVRRLTVDERFVTPPPDVAERIRKETERLNSVHSAVSRDRLWEGAFQPPVAAPAGSSFGKRSILNGQPRSPHSGVDFGAPEGTPVQAPNSGRVVLAADLYFSGNTVILDHGLGLYSLFAHLSRIEVKEGDAVGIAQVMGRVGSTGRSTGPHLHWSVRLVQCRVDPMALVALTAAGSGNSTPKRR